LASWFFNFFFFKRLIIEIQVLIDLFYFFSLKFARHVKLFQEKHLRHDKHYLINVTKFC
jgi:hypothetical protein